MKDVDQLDKVFKILSSNKGNWDIWKIWEQSNSKLRSLQDLVVYFLQEDQQLWPKLGSRQLG